MIDIKTTLECQGYDPQELSKGSNKLVCCVCDGCGKIRWLPYRSYKDLCLQCACRTETFRTNMSVVTKGRKLTEDHKRKIGESCKGGKRTEATKRKMSEAQKGICPTKETREKLSKSHTGKTGEKASNWQGGLSFEPYCSKFNNVFKERIREKFNRICFICGEPETGKKLCVHHVNYDKACLCNDIICEFVPLCVSCHSKTNFDRDAWERLIINVLQYENVFVQPYVTPDNNLYKG